jgi:nicotinate-nucleotide pyrophosphorylase
VSSGIGFGVGCVFIIFHALFLVFGGSWATSSAGSIQFITTAPATKPSVQTRLVLQAMADGERVSQENWSRVIETLEGVSSRLKDVERVQQQIMILTELVASVAEQAAKERNDLGRKLEETGRVVA